MKKSPIYLVAAFAALISTLVPSAAAQDFRLYKGDGQCGYRFRIITYAEAMANKETLCRAFWRETDILRFADRGSLGGRGLPCEPRARDVREATSTLCVRAEPTPASAREESRPAGAPTGQPRTGECRIRQKSSGLYLDAYQTADRDYAVVTRPDQDDDTQVWLVEVGSKRQGNLDLPGVTLRQKSSGRYLDAYEDGSSDSGAVTRSGQSDWSQFWLTAQYPVGTSLRQSSSPGSYLDAYQSQEKDFRAVTRPRQGDDTQRWVFECSDR